MQTISSRPKVMTVAGGHTLTTKYGSYRVEIEPLITGGDRFLDCQGVNSIAGSLKKQSLHKVNKELRETGYLDPNVPLPKHAAGGDVGILVGIQDVQLDPVLIAVLPSGTGVYRCPFIDMWGSQIAFRGPHPSFTASTNNSSGHRCLQDCQRGLQTRIRPLGGIAETQICVTPPCPDGVTLHED